MRTSIRRFVSRSLTILVSAVLLTSCRNFSGDTLGPREEPPAADSTSTPPGPYRLSPDPRQAVVLESYRALDPCYCGSSNKQIGGWLAGDWNYLTDPWDNLGGWRWIKQQYGSYLSNFSSAYTDPGSYGFLGGYGRGFQCKAFANYILYRSGIFQQKLPSYADAYNDYVSGRRNYTKPVSQVRVGDVIQTFATNGHAAIVVRIMAGVEGSSVTSVEVVDSNWIGNEIIGKHVISSLSGYYAFKLY